MEDFPAAAFIGIICGLLGALYIYVSHNVNYYRKKILKSKPLKILEAFILCMVTITLFYWAPVIYEACTDLPA